MPIRSMAVRAMARGCVAVLLVASVAVCEEKPGPVLIPAPPAAVRPDQLAGLDTPEGRLAYALGIRIGSRIAADLKAQGTEADSAALARGLADAVLGAAPLMQEEDLARALDAFDRKMQKREESLRVEWAGKAKANKQKTAEFLAENARRRGVRTMPCGLQYEILSKGDGPQVKPDGAVAVHFVGRHVDGREFDRTSAERGPAVVSLDEVIRGWKEALPLMPAGSKWRLFVPPELSYGEEGLPPEIEPNELLIFELEVMSVVGRKPG